jgi:large subunit ribosomal protein L35
LDDFALATQAFVVTFLGSSARALAGRYETGDKTEDHFLEKAAFMPKMKTHKATKKRFRITANGKVKHRGAGTSHLAVRMSQKRKRNLRGTRVLAKCDQAMIHKALCGNSY